MFNSNSVENDADPVVKEIPVYLSKKLSDKLFIFQYPMKPSCQGYDTATFNKSLIKPENQQVILEVDINTTDLHYDINKGQAIAANTEKVSKKDHEDEEKIFESNCMDKLTLHSSRALPKCDNYAIGVFQDGELHLTPLKSIVQMRPQFNYLEKSDKKSKDDGKNTDDEMDEEEPIKQINVTFAKPVPDFLKKMKEQSFQTHSQKILEEEWIPVQYKPTSSSKSELTKLELFYSSNDDSRNNLNLRKEQYLEMLAPPLKEEQFSKANIPSHTTSLSYIRTLPLLDQVRILMKDAKVMSFVQLRSILSTEHESSSILKYLQQVAVLVQGNWVVNSELIYPKDSMSAHSGIPAELMCRARDYVLLSFTDQEFVDRRAVSSVVKLPAEEIREIFTNIAKHQPKKGWRLIVPLSKEFNERYPEIAQRQEMLWEAKRKHLREAMEAHHQGPQRHRRKSNRESFSSENEEKTQERNIRNRKSQSKNNDTADVLSNSQNVS